MKIINKNLALAYKKRNDKDVLNKAKLKFDKEMMEFFPLSSEDGDLIFFYENKTIELRKGTSEKEIELKNENKVKKNDKKYFINMGKNKRRLLYTFNISSIRSYKSYGNR